jgi:hypothetical protein
MSDTKNDTPEQDSHEPAGLPDRSEVPEQEIEEIESERNERLDPDNRPDNAEVDNTDRDFDTTRGQFTDTEDQGLGPFVEDIT